MYYVMSVELNGGARPMAAVPPLQVQLFSIRKQCWYNRPALLQLCSFTAQYTRNIFSKIYPDRIGMTIQWLPLGNSMAQDVS